MSFINLMGNDIWTEADIVRRTESIIRSQFSEDDERILNRKVTGLLLGQYELTNEEQAELAKFQQVVYLAQQVGNEARNDMALLNSVFPVEVAYRRISQPIIEPIEEDGEIVNQTDIDNDFTERVLAQSVIESATEEVLELVKKRNPVIE